jgi:phage-related protein (TIGR01555 family)
MRTRSLSRFLDAAPPAPTTALAVRDTTSSALCPSGVSVTTSGWMNPMTGLGVAGLDPTAALQYRAGQIPTPMTVDKLYTYDWLADRIIEKMPSVALVRGYGVRGSTPESARELLKQFDALNRNERFPRGVFERGVLDGRAHGGAVLWIGYNKGQPFTPLTDEQRQGGIAFFDLFAQHELRVLKRDLDPRSPLFGMPSVYQVIANGYGPQHPRVGQIFHASRSIRMSGRTLRVPNNGLEVSDMSGWHSQPELGVSVLTPVLQDIGRYGLAWSAVSNILQDASIGVMRLSGLVEGLASEAKDLIEDRLRVLQETRSVHRMMFLDRDNDEEFTRTEASMTDVPAIMQQLMANVAGCAETPASIFFSSSPSGLNANSKGEADLTQFYNTCANYQKYYLGPKLAQLLTAVNGGKEVEVEWPSLWESSDNEKAQTRTAHANADKIYWDIGYSAKQIAAAREKGTFVEMSGEEPDDSRDDVSGAGEPEETPPAGAPGKQGAAKIATKQRAEQKK